MKKSEDCVRKEEKRTFRSASELLKRNGQVTEG